MQGHYAVRIGVRAGAPPAKWEVLEEDCLVEAPSGGPRAHFHIPTFDDTNGAGPQGEWLPDRLYLPTAAGRPAFRPVYDALSRLCVYRPLPRAIEDVQTLEPLELLRPDGGNVASVLFRLGTAGQTGKERVEEYLRIILPGLMRVRVEPILKEVETRVFELSKVGILFEQASRGGVHLFWPSQMSDGTLRALAILTALFQGSSPAGPRLPLVAIEDPEAHVHPAVLGVLRDAMTEASYSTQVLATTQSADLLDEKEVATESILAVTAEEGQTRIGPVDEASRSVLRQRLFTVGQLLRMNQLSPDAGLGAPAPSPVPPVVHGETG
jgi:hypothetical protein